MQCEVSLPKQDSVDGRTLRCIWRVSMEVEAQKQYRIKDQLGPDSHDLAAYRRTLQQGEAHSDVCPMAISAILCFVTQELEVRCAVLALYNIYWLMSQHHPIFCNTRKLPGPREVIYGSSRGILHISMLSPVHCFPRCPNYGHRGRTEIAVEEEWKYFEDLFRVFFLSMTMEKLLGIFPL